MLSLSNIYKRFPVQRSFFSREALQVHAIDGVSLDVPRGKTVGLVGESGCGKTTLGRVALRLIPPDAGSIRFGGRDITSLSGEELRRTRRRMQIIFQDPYSSLNPRKTVGSIIGLTPRVHRIGDPAGWRRRVEEMMELVGLTRRLYSHYPSQLSGGQQQRIALARALATSPGLLLLDEPLSALDALERVRLRQEIRALQQRLGVTTIMVTHDQEEALSMADRIVVMNHGAIEQIGSALEIYREPASPFVADFVGKVNVLTGTAQNGGVRVGSVLLSCSEKPSGHAVRVYLRPEDIVARPIAAGDSNVVDSRIDKIEFLGSYCLVRVSAEGLGQPLTVYLSLNFLSELDLAPGKQLRLRILPERLRLFDA